VFVGLSVHLRISKTMAKLPKIFCACYCGHGLVLLSGQLNMLCTSSFVDDVTFSHNGAYFAFTVVTGCLKALYSFE